ncbi:MAG: VIT1/CCC1 transporter family protein [candidate division KSB1 bacterium]|nr:VIT1/CCC1 transporter family protein [candidate division KSB1 bacterium]
MEKDLYQSALIYQKNEITEYHIYQYLSGIEKNEKNKKILLRIAEDEYSHYKEWKKVTNRDVKPNTFKKWWFSQIGRLLGITFSIKLMEHGEKDAQEEYSRWQGQVERIDAIIEDENSHEEELINLIDEERLQYAGSIVLGLNDALVELTGALAGLTLALQNTALIALSGSITGIAAALSMGASEYLSTKSEETQKKPLRASLYTGTAYLLTVIVLILPYLILDNYYWCLAFTLLGAILIIALFNYYIAVAKDESFRHRFWEMAGLSLSVAAFSFLIGFLLRSFLGIEI